MNLLFFQPPIVGPQGESWYTAFMTDAPRSIQDLLDTLPRCLSHSKQMAGTGDVAEQLRKLAAQALLLSVREWFDQQPHDMPGFELSMESLKKIAPRNPETIPPEFHAAVQDLCQRLISNNPFGDINTTSHLILLMNEFKWPRERADYLLGAVASVRAGVSGGELFATADQSKLDMHTDIPLPQGGHKHRL